MGSPGRITYGEVMEVLFGYLVFAGLDKLFSLIASMWSKDETDKRTKTFFQLAGIIVALVILFRHKFFT